MKVCRAESSCAEISGPFDFVKTVLPSIEAPSLTRLHVETGLPVNFNAAETIALLFRPRHDQLLDQLDTLHVHSGQGLRINELYIGDASYNHGYIAPKGRFSVRLSLQAGPDELRPALSCLLRVFRSSPLRDLHLVDFSREDSAPASAWNTLFSTFGPSLRSLELLRMPTETAHVVLDAMEAWARAKSAESLTGFHPIAFKYENHYVRNTLVMHDFIAHLLRVATTPLRTPAPTHAHSSGTECDALPQTPPAASESEVETEARILHSVGLKFWWMSKYGNGTGMSLPVHRWMLLALAYQCQLDLKVAVCFRDIMLQHLFSHEEIQRIAARNLRLSIPLFAQTPSLGGRVSILLVHSRSISTSLARKSQRSF